MIVDVRNTALKEILTSQSLGTDFSSPIIDFKEMNTALIQAITTVQPSIFDGKFTLYVSLLQDESTFFPYPDSERILNSECNNFGWAFPHGLPFRYAMLWYNANNVVDGTVEVYARAKRT